MSAWNEKVVVVTGGSDGLGLAIVKAFAKAGATVVSLARNQEKNLAAVQDVQGNVTALPCDVTNNEMVETAVNQIVTQFDGAQPHYSKFVSERLQHECTKYGFHIELS